MCLQLVFSRMVCSFRTWRTRCSHHFQMKTQGKACTGWAPCLMQRQEREGGLSAGTSTGTPECSFISKCEFLNIQPISRDRARTLKIQEQSCVKTLCTQTGLLLLVFPPYGKTAPDVAWPLPQFLPLLFLQHLFRLGSVLSLPHMFNRAPTAFLPSL